MLRLWRGEVPLADAFWSWAVIGGFAVNLASTFASLALFTQGRTMEALAAGHVVAVPYNLLAGVGVWRAAARYDGPAGLARAAKWVSAVGLAVLAIA